MKLLTKAIEKRFAQLGRQEEAGEDAIVVCKFFNPTGVGTWLATEMEKSEDDVLFFGAAEIGYEFELGYFSLSDLESFKGLMGLGIERDLYFSETTLKEAMLKEDRRGASR